MRINLIIGIEEPEAQRDWNTSVLARSSPGCAAVPGFRGAPAPRLGETSSAGFSSGVGSVWIVGCPECPVGLLAVPSPDGTPEETLVCGCESGQGRGGSLRCRELGLVTGGDGFLPNSGSGS